MGTGAVVRIPDTWKQNLLLCLEKHCVGDTLFFKNLLKAHLGFLKVLHYPYSLSF